MICQKNDATLVCGLGIWILRLVEQASRLSHHQIFFPFDDDDIDAAYTGLNFRAEPRINALAITIEKHNKF